MAKQFFDYYQPGKSERPKEFPTRPESGRTIGFDKPTDRQRRHEQSVSLDGFQPRRSQGGQPAFQAKNQQHIGDTAPTPEHPSTDARSRRSRADKGVALEPDADQKQSKPRKRWLKRLIIGFFTLVFVALLGVGWVSWKFFGETTKVFGGTPFGNAVKFFQPTTLKGQDSGHVNILIAGTSLDDPGHGGADLTDSIMVLSINTNTKQGYMFSIPRDLWVQIPDVGYRKINEAYHWGKTNNFSEAGLPAGGMGLLEKTIEQAFQIPINYYALVNYTALKNIVNALGGVDVNIQSPDPRGLYDPNINSQDGGPLQLPNGVNHLDGQTALNLARARGDPTMDGRVAYGFQHSDFDRTEHQRQLLAAIQAKMSSAGVLLNPIKLGKVLDGVGTNVTSDLHINEARKLASYVRGIGTGNLQSIALTTTQKNYLRGYTTSTGQSALIPAAGISNYDDIQGFIQPLLGSR